MSSGNILVVMRASRLPVMLATMAMMLWIAGSANDPDNDGLSSKQRRSLQ